MSTACALGDELARYLDGELSQNRSQELEGHVRECPACSRMLEELTHVRGALSVSEAEFDDPCFADDVLRTLHTSSPAVSALRRRSAPWRRPVGWFAAMTAVLAAAAALLLIVVVQKHPSPPQTVDGRGEFIARGATQNDAEQWLGLWVFRRANGKYQELSSTVRTRDALSFGYRNAKGEYRYLMIFAVDRAGRVFWYHPAYERSTDDPESIVVDQGQHSLPVEIEHDLAPGALRIFAVFSHVPRRVVATEQMLQALRKQTPDLTRLARLPLPDAAQLTRLLRVERDQ